MFTNDDNMRFNILDALMVISWIFQQTDMLQAHNIAWCWYSCEFTLLWKWTVCM